MMIHRVLFFKLRLVTRRGETRGGANGESDPLIPLISSTKVATRSSLSVYCASVKPASESALRFFNPVPIPSTLQGDRNVHHCGCTITFFVPDDCLSSL